MNRAELMEIIRNGESSGVEFKRDKVHPQSLAKEIASLANLEGGCILLGVENNDIAQETVIMLRQRVLEFQERLLRACLNIMARNPV